jgi:hypothetical protein
MAKKINEEKKGAEKPDTPYTENIYEGKDDIYSRAKEEKFEEDDLSDEDKTIDHSPAQGLDIPGTELDDKMEDVGEEDEENNYYSLGGDNHEDLEEDKG